MSWTSPFNEAKFQEIILPSLGCIIVLLYHEHWTEQKYCYVLDEKCFFNSS